MGYAGVYLFFLFLLQNIDYLAESVLTSTHNLCFGAKIRKIGIPLEPQFYYIKVGFKGVNITRTCFRDVQVGYSKFTESYIKTSDKRYDLILDGYSNETHPAKLRKLCLLFNVC